MRSLNLKRLKSFFTFDLPFNAGYSRLSLHAIHKQHSLSFPSWNIESTRRKVIADYWYKHVLYHFLSLFGVALLIVLPFNLYFNLLYFSILLAFGGIGFSVVIFCLYLPLFSLNFLPQLETLIAHYKKTRPVVRQEKCAKTQPKIPTLTVIHYVLLQTAGVKTICCDHRSAQLINTLTGVDTDSIKENLRRIYKHTALSSKERAEILKGITAARSFFVKLDLPSAIKQLDQLEWKLKGA